MIYSYINLYLNVFLLNKKFDKKGCLFTIILRNFEWSREGVREIDSELK